MGNIIPFCFDYFFIKSIIENKIVFLYGNLEERNNFIRFLFKHNKFFKVTKDFYLENNYFSLTEKLYLCKQKYFDILENTTDPIICNNGLLYGVGILTLNTILGKIKLNHYYVYDLCIDILNFLKQNNEKFIHIILFPKKQLSFEEYCILLLIKEMCYFNNLFYISLERRENDEI